MIAVLRLPNISWYWKLVLIPAKLAAVLGYQNGKRHAQSSEPPGSTNPDSIYVQRAHPHSRRPKR